MGFQRCRDNGGRQTGSMIYAPASLEYFAAWQLAVTSDTPEDLADQLITSIRTSGWEIVGELAIQINDRSTDQGADRTYQRILARTEHADDQVHGLFIKLLTKSLPGMPVSPAVVRRVTRVALTQLLPPNSMPSLLWDLRQCGTHHQSIVVDEFGSGIATMVALDQESDKLAGLQIALSMTMPTIPHDEFWDDWFEKLTTLYAAEVETFSAHSPTLRTLALFASIISIDQALAMSGGFDAISQRYPIIGIGPLVPYSLYMTPVFGDEDLDSASIAVSTAVGKYLVDNPTLPWARMARLIASAPSRIRLITLRRRT